MGVYTVLKRLRESNPQLVYLNSCFDFSFAILPLLVVCMTRRRVPIVLAPRGEFSVGALALKRRKKRVFIIVFRLLRFHNAVVWHVSTGREKEDIERMFGPSIKSYIAINLRDDLKDDRIERGRKLQASDNSHLGSIISFSRIVPKKNVAAVIQAMSFVCKNIQLSIAGPIEDVKYWNRCRELIDNVPNPKNIKYLGDVPPDEVISFLNGFDLFVFPTLGENFGHVILESLAAGTPVIVGWDTPWQQIESAGAGWLCDPGNPELIAEMIERFFFLDQEDRQRMRAAAFALAREILNDRSAVAANKSMFRTLIRDL